MTNKVDKRKEISIKDIALMNPSNKYILRVEKGWWSSQEAICTFLRYSIEEAYNFSSFERITATKDGQDLKKLVAAAEADSAIEGIVFDKIFWVFRASCKAWMEWALTKPSISIEDELLEAVGIKTPRSKESYRQTEEPEIRNKFIGFASATLYDKPLTPLKEVKDKIIDAKLLPHLPTDKTLRKWLKNAAIKLKGKPGKPKRKN